MYDIISQIIDHTWTTSSSEQTQIYYICGALIIVLTVFFIDLVYRVFSNFWRSKK